MVTAQLFGLMRIINAGVTQKQWSDYMKEVYRVLEPGTGWAQCTEFQGHGLFAEGNVPEDSALREVWDTITKTYFSLKSIFTTCA